MLSYYCRYWHNNCLSLDRELGKKLGLPTTYEEVTRIAKILKRNEKMHKTTMRNITKACAALAVALGASAGNAASVTWNFATGCAVACNNLQTFTQTSGGVSVTLSAYYATPNGANSLAASAWAGAVFDAGSSGGPFGLGIINPAETDTVPNNSIDSSTSTDLLVFDAGAGKTINWSTFQIESGQNNGVNGSADIKVWAGNNAIGAGTTIGALAGLGYVSSTISNVPNYTGTGNIDNGSLGAIGAARYLVMAGDINDAFRLKNITGTSGSGGSSTPEPGSIALIGLGLLGFGIARKRRAA
jgi:hypothetical protein